MKEIKCDIKISEANNDDTLRVSNFGSIKFYEPSDNDANFVFKAKSCGMKNCGKHGCITHVDFSNSGIESCVLCLLDATACFMSNFGKGINNESSEIKEK